MEKIKVRIEKSYHFVKGGDCESCELYDLCNEVDCEDCQAGENGHYELDDEEIEQL